MRLRTPRRNNTGVCRRAEPTQVVGASCVPVQGTIVRQAFPWVATCTTVLALNHTVVPTDLKTRTREDTR